MAGTATRGLPSPTRPVDPRLTSQPLCYPVVIPASSSPTLTSSLEESRQLPPLALYPPAGYSCYDQSPSPHSFLTFESFHQQTPPSERAAQAETALERIQGIQLLEAQKQTQHPDTLFPMLWTQTKNLPWVTITNLSRIWDRWDILIHQRNPDITKGKLITSYIGAAGREIVDSKARRDEAFPLKSPSGDDGKEGRVRLWNHLMEQNLRDKIDRVCAIGIVRRMLLEYLVHVWGIDREVAAGLLEPLPPGRGWWE